MMDEENRNSPFIEELGGADVPSEPLSAPDYPPHDEEPPVETAPEAEPEPDPHLRLESEIRYLMERADDAEAELTTLRQKNRRLKVVGLLVIAAFVFFLVQVKLYDSKLETGLSALAARIANPGADSTGVAKINAASAPAWHVSSIAFVTWNQGETPVRLIKQSEGFCVLTEVAGHFAGDGESVRLWIDSDGYWCLGGGSQQQGVTAQCAVLRY